MSWRCGFNAESNWELCNLLKKKKSKLCKSASNFVEIMQTVPENQQIMIS